MDHTVLNNGMAVWVPQPGVTLYRPRENLSLCDAAFRQISFTTSYAVIPTVHWFLRDSLYLVDTVWFPKLSG